MYFRSIKTHGLILLEYHPMQIFARFGYMIHSGFREEA
jgi:hypothetical protein